MESAVHQKSWGSSVSIVSDYRLDNRCSNPGRGKEILCSLCVYQLWGLPSLLSGGCRGPFSWVKRGQDVIKNE
jgi:hypothetical protein